jgi:hypothetical protein
MWSRGHAQRKQSLKKKKKKKRESTVAHALLMERQDMIPFPCC